MDHLQNRLEALEQQTYTVQRQLRWWRGLACGLIVLAVLTWALPAGTAPGKSLEQRVAALETLLIHFSRDSNNVFVTGANLHIVNGLGATTTTNGLGNLIVGYNEPTDTSDQIACGALDRTGSHNVVVGSKNSFTRFGGLVVGWTNAITGDFASVSGGDANTASGDFASVSGGNQRIAPGEFDWVAGTLFEDQ
jgi:hypothetical protein